VLVEFSRWCGPCKTVAPELLAIPDELRGRQVVIDVDKSPMIARELGVQSV
jgi:thioredoxin 1/putative thioredoxin